MLQKQIKRKKRHVRVRGKFMGNKSQPRLCVFRSNKHIYAQLIDDEKNKVLANISDAKIKTRGAKTDFAKEVGKLLAKEALALKINKVVFDRAGYKYHGRIKSLAEGAREGGLKF